MRPGATIGRAIADVNAPCNNITTALGCVSQDFTGRQLHRAPKLDITFGTDFKQDLTQGMMIGLNADASYTSSFYSHENLNPVSHQKGFWRVGAGARVFADDNRWELALIGRNIFNEIYKTQSFDKTGGPRRDRSSD